MNATATTPRQQPAAERQQQATDPEFARLMSKNARVGGLFKTLSTMDEKIESVLPDFMKGQAQRLISRALMTFAMNSDLHACPDEDFRRCVVEGAEMGFAIDGKLAYVVKYKQTYQLQLDYKAIVAVAKRNRTIKDIDADVVCQADHFKHGKYGSQSVLEHTFALELPRGEVIGAYCRVYLPDGSWNYEVMTRPQLDAVQRRAPAQNGPWKTDPDEMRKKTVIRRKLKLYRDDPGLMRMLEITAWEDETDDEPPAPATMKELTASLRNNSRPQAEPSGNGHREQLAAGEIPNDEPTPPPAETYDRPQTADEPSPDIIAGLDMDLPEAQGFSDVDAVKAKWLRNCTTDADRTAVAGRCEARANELRAAKKK